MNGQDKGRLQNAARLRLRRNNASEIYGGKGGESSEATSTSFWKGDGARKYEIKLEEESKSSFCSESSCKNWESRSKSPAALPKKSDNLTYKQILVKNPALTNKKRLTKDQSTLDAFIVDFKQSKYLKTTILVNRKYKQLTIDDFKGARQLQGQRHKF